MMGQSTIPLPEHPRPDFNRSIWKNLNAMWDFRFNPNNIGLIEKWNLGENKFDKDKDDIIIEEGIDFMKGSIQSPSTNPNSYPMTDTKLFQSNIDVFVNDRLKQNITLFDDPADHRGVLSWHSQIRSELGSATLNEAGSYGYLIKIPISDKELENSINNGNIKIKMKTKGDGGIAIYENHLADILLIQA